MIKKITETPLTYWSNPEASIDIINRLNDIVGTLNDLCAAHDELVRQHQENTETIDYLCGIAKGQTQELDS